MPVARRFVADNSWEGVWMTRECELCTNPANKTWKRCEKHYRCDYCLTTDDLCTHSEGVFCDSCRETWVANRLATFADPTDYTSHIVCPHCGYTNSDSCEMSEGEQQCNDCDLYYDMTRHVEVTYSTVKIPPRK